MRRSLRWDKVAAVAWLVACVVVVNLLGYNLLCVVWLAVVVNSVCFIMSIASAVVWLLATKEDGWRR